MLRPKAKENGILSAVQNKLDAELRPADEGNPTRGPAVARRCLIGVLLLAGALYVFAMRPATFGSYHDDSIFVTTAKALATGQGYRVISLPGEPIQAKSPPFHPFLLSLIWRAAPGFPENIFWMMLLSVAATICFLGLVWRYIASRGYGTMWQALISVTLVAMNWRTVVLAGGVYSEMIYAALSVGALYLAEQYEERQKSWVLGLSTGAVVGLAFLTRSAGIAALLAVGVYYVVRRFKRGVFPVAIASAIVLGWLVWGSMHTARADDVNAGVYESYFSTFSHVIDREQAPGLAERLGVVATVAGTNAVGLILTSVPLVCLGLNYSAVIDSRIGFPLVAGAVLLLIAMGFLRQIRRRFRLMHAYVLAYLALHLFWPYSAYDRFLMPVLPFLMLWFVVEVGEFWPPIRDALRPRKSLSNKVSASIIAMLVVSAAIVTLYNYGSGLSSAVAFGTFSKPDGPTPEDREAIEWITTNTNPSDVVICYRDPLYYLYTGRKAGRSVFSREGGLLDVKAGLDEKAKSLFRIVEQNGGRYLVVTSSDFELESGPDAQRADLNAIVERNPAVFEAVFRASNGRSVLYRIDESGLRAKAGS